MPKEEHHNERSAVSSEILNSGRQYVPEGAAPYILDIFTARKQMAWQKQLK